MSRRRLPLRDGVRSPESEYGTPKVEIDRGLKYLVPVRPPSAVTIKPVRERWTSDREYFLAPNGDDSRSGTSFAQAWATPIFAHENLLWNHDIAGYNVFLRFAPGTYTGVRGQLAAWGQLVGQETPFNYNWTGVFGNPSAVKLQGFGFHAHDTCQLLITDVEISTNQTGCLGTFAGLLMFGRVRFVNVPGRYHIWARELGCMVAIDSYEIAGSARAHAFAFNRGSIMVSNKVTIAPGVSFDAAFAMPQSGIIDYTGATFSGSFQGRRYACTDGGAVRTGTGNPNFFPGSIPGTTSIRGVTTGFYS